MRKLLSSKKGQVQNIAPAVIVLVIAATILVFGIIMTQEIRDTDTLQAVGTVTNETLVSVDEGGEILSAFGLPGYTSITIIGVANDTDGGTIPASNYTLTSSTGLLVYSGGVAVGDDSYNNTNWNVTYSYQAGSEGYEATNNTLVGLGKFGDFWEIIVLAIIISVVIGLLMSVFGGRSSRR